MTIRQKKLAKELGNSRTFQEAALKAGYAPSTAHQQESITSTKGWKELLEAHLPDEELLKAPKEALKATKIVISHTEPDKEIPDHIVRLKASEQGFKLKGKFAPEQINQFNVGEMSVQFREKTDDI